MRGFHLFRSDVAPFVIGVPLLVAQLAGTAHAQCTTLTDAWATRRSVWRAADCNYKILRYGPGTTCLDATPPACAGSIVSDTVALTYGPNNPPAGKIDARALSKQLSCQRRVGRAAAHFIGRKLGLLIRGKSLDYADRTARIYLDRLVRSCTVPVAQDVSGIILPAVNPPCDATVGGVAHLADGDALRACLLPALEVAVDRIAPVSVPKPNLIIILTDDQRWDTTGLEHSLDGVTPVMPHVQSELASQGVSFPNAFVTTALCCPSRSSLLRGEYAHTTGVLTNSQPLGGAPNFDDSSTMATWLSGAGYRTGFFGKYLNAYNLLWTSPNPPYIPPGWNEWHAFKAPKFYDFTLVEHGAADDHAQNVYASGCAGSYNTCPGDNGTCANPVLNYSTDVLLAKALAFLDQSGGQPFFLYFAPYAPHAPACAAEGDVGSFASLTPWRPPNWNEADTSDKPMWVQSLCPMGTGKQVGSPGTELEFAL